MAQLKPKKTKPITAQRLMNAATHYLGRFEATQARLQAVLERKVRRWAQQQDISDHMQLIEDTIKKCVDLQLVDDARYGALRKDQLLRKGQSARTISQDLRHKGVSADLTNALTSSIEEKDQRAAAMRLAQRRRLGPFRGPREAAAFAADPKKQTDKEIAAFARAGHSFSFARAVLDMESVDALEAWVSEAE